MRLAVDIPSDPDQHRSTVRGAMAAPPVRIGPAASNVRMLGCTILHPNRSHVLVAIWGARMLGFGSSGQRATVPRPDIRLREAAALVVFIGQSNCSSARIRGILALMSTRPLMRAIRDRETGRGIDGAAAKGLRTRMTGEIKREIPA
jgi:hypothetical protein